MKSGKEYLILIGIAVVLVLYLVFHQSDRTLYELPELPQIEAAEVSRIEIHIPADADGNKGTQEQTASGGKTLELVKAGGKWRIQPQDHAAAANKVDPMIDAITGLQLTALVSEAKNYTRYELGEEQRITVKAWADDKLVRSFAIGKKASSTQHTFVKLPDDPRVYHASSNFRHRFEQSAESLRDKTVFAVKPEKVQAIEIRQEETRLAISRVQPEVTVSAEKEKQGTPAENANEGRPIWQNARGEAVPADAVEGLLDALSMLKCKSYITERKADDFSDPIYTVKLTTDQTHTLSIFEQTSEDADTYPAVASGIRDPFHLSNYKAENIMSAIEGE